MSNEPVDGHCVLGSEKRLAELPNLGSAQLLPSHCVIEVLLADDES
jgi:hypothetical protein